MIKITKFLDHLEDKTREQLSRMPIVYAIIGGIMVVIFWRGVWHLADQLERLGGWWTLVFSPDVSLLVSVLVMLSCGLFVSFFIGDRIIMSGLKHEKKVEEKTEAEVREEEAMIEMVNTRLGHMQKELEEIKALVKK